MSEKTVFIRLLTMVNRLQDHFLSAHDPPIVTHRGMHHRVGQIAILTFLAHIREFMHVMMSEMVGIDIHEIECHVKRYNKPWAVFCV